MSQNIINTARGVVIDNGELLVFRLAKAGDWYSLPGGKIEFGESIEQAIEREMFEETGIKAQVGKLLLVHDMALPDKHRIEFFYHIKNAGEYRNLNLSKATHGFEIAEATFVDPVSTDKIILPDFLREIVPEIVRVGVDNFQFRVIKGKQRES